MINHKDITTVSELMQTIRDLLSNELGKFENKKTSIWIEPERSPPPTPGQGLHVYINRYPKPLQPARSKGASQSEQQLYWEVALRLHGNNTAAMDSARLKVQQYWPRTLEIPLPYRDDAPLETRFRLPFVRIINCYQTVN